ILLQEHENCIFYCCRFFFVQVPAGITRVSHHKCLAGLCHQVCAQLPVPIVLLWSSASGRLHSLSSFFSGVPGTAGLSLIVLLFSYNAVLVLYSLSQIFRCIL